MAKSLFLAASAIMAAAQPAWAQRPIDLPASPRSLPGDRLPPFYMLDERGRLTPIPQGLVPPPTGPGSAPESSAPGPTLDEAAALARAAIDACVKAGFRVGVAVVDSAGEARAMLTADGSDGSHVFVAQRKAIVSVVFGAPSSVVNEAVRAGRTPLSQITPAMFVMEGAVPLKRGDTVIGALGVSGAAAERQDEICAEDGMKAFLAGGRGR